MTRAKGTVLGAYEIVAPLGAGGMGGAGTGFLRQQTGREGANARASAKAVGSKARVPPREPEGERPRRRIRRS